MKNSHITNYKCVLVDKAGNEPTRRRRNTKKSKEALRQRQQELKPAVQRLCLPGSKLNGGEQKNNGTRQQILTSL